MKRIILAASLFALGFVLFLIAYNPDPEEIIAPGEGAANNPVVDAGGIAPHRTVVIDREPAEGAQTPQAETGTAQQAQMGEDDRNLSYRVYEALVNPGAGATGAISAQVNPALRDPAAVPTVRNAQVTASNGVVTVYGHVASEADKENVESIVRQIPGVVAVRNQVTVTP